MREISLTLSSYRQEELYDIVADVASYNRFIPFCTGSRIVRELPTTGAAARHASMDAELTVGFLAFKESYVSRVTCIPYTSVEVRLVFPQILIHNRFPPRQLRPRQPHCLERFRPLGGFNRHLWALPDCHPIRPGKVETSTINQHW